MEIIVGIIAFGADDGTDLITGAAQITCEIDGTPGSNDMPGRLSFWTTADGSNSLSERLRITSGGNVGITETSPQTALHIGAGGVFRFERGDGTRYGEIFNDNNFVELKSSTDPVRVNAQSYLRFDIGGSEKGRFITGGGLCFNGDTTDANALDDYEEGTWTPAVTFGGNAASVVYDANTGGHYVKIGRMVYVHGRLQLTNKGSSAGTALITGLPFTAVDRASGGSSLQGGVFFTYISNILSGTDHAHPVGDIRESTTVVNLSHNDDSGDLVALSNNNFENATSLSFDGLYPV